jgi:asparagine synthase (glutamine-hydrolysing)
MCGLAGFLETQGGPEEGLAFARLAAMAEAIRHRGPDSEGAWIDGAAGVGLAHRRLAIVELSPAGAQPMLSASGRLVLVFNGEIYNHLDLRLALGADAPAWRGHSDTETLLAAFETWGVEETLRRAIGMFAIALWDRAARTLTLARDRMGEKPLYYGWGRRDGQPPVLLFGSELRALRAHPDFDPAVDCGALGLLLRYGYVSGPATIHAGVRRLPPACFVRIEVGRPDPEPVPYWRAPLETAEAGPVWRDETEAMDGVEAALAQAVAGQMMSDVPIGAFLSGGVDSSLVVALMRRAGGDAPRTFCIGFEDPSFDESSHARAVAAHLGARHTEFRLGDADALAVVPTLPELYDEPFADASQVPTALVSRIARGVVTVALSGDGGDELFAGYPRYQKSARLWRLRARAGGALSTLAAAGLDAAPAKLWRAVDALRGRGPWDRGETLGQKAIRLADLLRARDLADFHRRYVSQWFDPAAVARNGAGAPGPLDAERPGVGALAIDERFMALDAASYLPEDLMVKVDRAAMAVSLETRAPFLDPRVVAAARRTPFALKRRDGRNKWLLRQILHRHVPRALVDRPKAGFSTPVGAWLRGPLRGWAEALLAPERLAREGYLNPGPIAECWRAHLSGRANWEHRLWHVLVFQAWFERWGRTGS